MVDTQDSDWKSQLIFVERLEMENGLSVYVFRDPCIDGIVYFSDEVGGGVEVWNPALVSIDTLEYAIKDFKKHGYRKRDCEK